MDRFYPQCYTTAIGTFPHTVPGKIIERILKYFPEIPCWPQLPNAGFLENSHVQFSEGLPKFILDISQKRGFFDTSRTLHESLKAFQKCYESNDINYFAISLEFAGGLHYFLDTVIDRGIKNIRCLKGQVTGPLSFGFHITDEKHRPVINNPEILDIVVKCLTMKARWQIRQLKKIHSQVIIFINEPLLSSASKAISREKVVTVLNEVIDGIHNEEGLAGIYSNESYDLTTILGTRTDFLNYNASNPSDMRTFPSDILKSYLEKGGNVIWGIIPASETIHNETTATITEKFETIVEILSDSGLDQQIIVNQALITPSGGLDLISEKSSDQVLKMANAVSKSLRKKYYKSNA